MTSRSVREKSGALLFGLRRLAAACASLVRAPGQTLARLREQARHSLRTRLAVSMVCLSVASCLVLGLCSYITYEITLRHIIRWHMDPILWVLTDAKHNGASSDQIHSLAATFNVDFYDGTQMPPDLHPDHGDTELVRIERDRYAYASTDSNDVVYAVVGKVEDLDDIEEVMLSVALACAGVSLVAALLLSWWLTRRLVTPLVTLTGNIRSGKSLEDTPLSGRKDEVGELARAFVERERSLRAFLVREQLFTGDVSHELRTPLTILQGGAEILESRLSASDQQKSLLPVVQRMQRTLESMTGTVSTMLLLARTPEQLECRLFDMSALARNEDESVAELLRNRPITYTRQLPDTLMVRGNPDLAMLVLHNLLDNACRYTQEGTIFLQLEATGFALQDTAPPIAEEVRQRMFERGVRGASKVPGSGLGLSLVQRGCERLGWSVRHELKDGGNRFVVCFQVQPDSRDRGGA